MNDIHASVCDFLLQLSKSMNFGQYSFCFDYFPFSESKQTSVNVHLYKIQCIRSYYGRHRYSSYMNTSVSQIIELTDNSLPAVFKFFNQSLHQCFVLMALHCETNKFVLRLSLASLSLIFSIAVTQNKCECLLTREQLNCLQHLSLNCHSTKLKMHEKHRL